MFTVVQQVLTWRVQFLCLCHSVRCALHSYRLNLLYWMLKWNRFRALNHLMYLRSVDTLIVFFSHLGSWFLPYTKKKKNTTVGFFVYCLQAKQNERAILPFCWLVISFCIRRIRSLKTFFFVLTIPFNSNFLICYYIYEQNHRFLQTLYVYPNLYKKSKIGPVQLIFNSTDQMG